MKTPTFLNQIEVTDLQRAYYMQVLGNWLGLHQYLSEQPDDDDTLQLIGRLLVVELSTRCRVSIISRLKSRYNRLRAKIEMSEIQTLTKTVSQKNVG